MDYSFKVIAPVSDLLLVLFYNSGLVYDCRRGTNMTTKKKKKNSLQSMTSMTPSGGTELLCSYYNVRLYRNAFIHSFTTYGLYSYSTLLSVF